MKYLAPSHVAIALLLQALGFAAFGDVWAGAAVGIAFFIAREITQAEYRWIEANGGLRAAMPWWKGLDVRLWTTHSIGDVLAPAAAVIGASLAYAHFVK